MGNLFRIAEVRNLFSPILIIMNKSILKKQFYNGEYYHESEWASYRSGTQVDQLDVYVMNISRILLNGVQ